MTDKPILARVKSVLDGAAQWEKSWFGVAFVLTALSAMHFAQGPVTALIDPSWSGVLVWAHEHGASFGKDIVFTYGPLGFLSIDYFSPLMAGERMVFEIVVKTIMALGVCLLAWRMPRSWRIGALAFFILIVMPLQNSGDAIVFAGLWAWGFLCFTESGGRLWLCAIMLAAAAATVGLIKFTYLAVGGMTVFLAAVGMGMGKNRAPAAWGAVLFGFGFLAGWLLLGQTLGGLSAYLANEWAVSSGYNASMAGLTNFSKILFMTLVPAVAAIAIRVLTYSAPAGRKGVFAAWLGGILFIVWKCSAVRQDGLHASVALALLPLAALSMEALPETGRRMKLWSRGATLLAVLLVVVLGNNRGPWAEELAWKNISQSADTLVQPRRYIREKTQDYEKEKTREQLPKFRALVGTAPVDVFGFNQGTALLNDFNYRPAPVFQGYFAYSRALMQLNEDFYLSANAPEYVIFGLQPIDSRLPSLENAMELRHLLWNFDVAASEGDYLLLRRKRREAAKLTLLQTGTADEGEKIALPPGNTNLWMEIDRHPTWFGRLQRILYRPPQMVMFAWLPGISQPDEFNTPAAMLSAGFLVNPLLLTTKDVADFYAKGTRRTATSIAIQDEHPWMKAWERQMEYRIYRVEGTVGG